MGESSRRGGRAYRRALVAGMTLSLLLHLGAFLLWRGAPVPLSPGPGASTSLAAPQSGALTAVAFELPQRAPVPPPPRPRLELSEPELVPVRPPASGPRLAAPPTALRPAAFGGPGSWPGEAEGDGEGGASRTAPPVPRSLFPQWDPPPAVRGMRVLVRVEVDERGRPTGRVELYPPTPDRAFNRKLMEKVERMDYHPALRDGVPVGGWAEVTFVF